MASPRRSLRSLPQVGAQDAVSARKQRVCLINPPTLTAPKSLSYYGATPPLGLAYVAAAARASGHEVSVIDATGDGLETTRPWETQVGTLVLQGLDIEQIVARIDPATTVVGVSHMFLHQWPWIAELLAAIKDAVPGVITVVGGENATAYWHEMFPRCPSLDVCVLGEGEESFIAVLARVVHGDATHWPTLADCSGLALRNSDGQPASTGARARNTDIDQLPRPAWDLFPLEQYLSHGFSSGVQRGRSMPFLTSRGCPYQCTFCSSPQMWTTRYVRRSPQLVLDEIEHYIAIYQIDNIDLNDLTAMLTKDWIMEFCDAIASRGLNVTLQFPSGTRSEAVDAESAQALYRAGCRNFCYAPESGSVRTLERIKKKIKIDRLQASLHASIAAGLTTHANIVIGFPHEQAQDLWATYKLVLQMARTGLHTVAVMVFAPYPGSELYAELKAEGLIHHDDAYWYSSLLRSAGALRSYHPTLSPNALWALQLGTLLSFFAMQAVAHPHRVLEILRNLADKRQETVMDQFLATKMEQFARKFSLDPKSDANRHDPREGMFSRWRRRRQAAANQADGEPKYRRTGS